MPDAQTQTYALSIKGEQHTYAVEAWNALDADTLCRILSDLTGYLSGYLREELPRRFDRLGYATMRPASSIGGTPSFTIRSSTGAPMPKSTTVKA